MFTAVPPMQVIGLRVRAQQLDLGTLLPADASVLDTGVQDSGPAGARWALANRGVDLALLTGNELVKVWALRGAPHLYRCQHLPSLAVTLDAVAAAMRKVVSGQMTKGELSTPADRADGPAEPACSAVPAARPTRTRCHSGWPRSGPA